MARPTTRPDKRREAELRDGVARSDRCKGASAQDALNGRLARAEFDALRKHVVPLAEAQGWLSDEDVFREIS